MTGLRSELRALPSHLEKCNPQLPLPVPPHTSGHAASPRQRQRQDDLAVRCCRRQLVELVDGPLRHLLYAWCKDGNFDPLRRQRRAAAAGQHQYKHPRHAYRRYLDVIADEFEEFHASQVTTKDCAGFLRDNFKSTPNTAKKYAALMSRLLKFIIGELGLRQDNPIDQLDMSSYKTGRREVLATHAQVQAIREAGMMSKERKGTGLSIPTASGPMFACIIDMSYLLWACGIDIRMLKESQIVDGRIRIKPSKTQKTSGKAVDIIVTPEIAEVIARARGLKIKYGLISQFVFPTQKGGAYTRSGLSSMWDRAKERIGMKDDVVFRDIRALAATDAARRGEDRSDIQKRLVHTSGKTTDIYIKEVIADVSEIPMALPWI
eukprot:gene20825-25013_t